MASVVGPGDGGNRYIAFKKIGGCAILTFGSLSHITFPTTFLDPSGANTFIGAKIQNSNKAM